MIRHYPKKHLLAALLLGGTVTALALTDPAATTVEKPGESVRKQITLIAPTASSEPTAQPGIVKVSTASIQTSPAKPTESLQALLPKPDIEQAPLPQPNWKEVTVKAGDTVSALFQRAGLSAREAYRVSSVDKKRELYKIKPGETFRILASDGVLTKLEYQKSRLEKLVFDATQSPITVKREMRTPEVRLAQASGVIEASLFSAGAKAGLSDRQIMNMAGIFGHVIDLVYDLRQGDHFHVVYEELYLDGEKFDEGKIIATEFVNQGERFSAFRYTDTQGAVGYYDQDGVSMRKAFLLAPLNYSRISSGFNLRRKHPVLNKIRAHKGTDYAAPTGTPVYAAGNGRVSFAGVKGGYGKTVIINHPGNVQTRYAHLNRIRVKAGTRVTQGKTIGTVGSTGLATGPHLHYEFILNGVHRNPRTILAKLPKAVSLAKAEVAPFKAHIQPKLALLEKLRKTKLAQLETASN